MPQIATAKACYAEPLRAPILDFAPVRTSTPQHTETSEEYNLRVFGCPYEHRYPNAETVAAIEECEDMRTGKIPRHAMPVADFFKDLGIEV
jgi:hypothetical protein